MNRFSELAQKYGIIVVVLGYFGWDVYLKKIGDNVIEVWNNPKEISEKYEKDSIHFAGKISDLEKKMEDVQSQIQTFENSQYFIKKTLYNVAMISKQETDARTYRGINYKVSNSNSAWLFIDDKAQHLLIPYRLNFEPEFDGFYYMSFYKENKHIEIKPKF